MPNISLFGAVFNTEAEDNFPIEAYLQEVKDGRYEDDVHKIRKQTDQKIRSSLKRVIQRVTFSGVFTKREDVGLVEHSGFIAIDFDSLEDVESTKKLMAADRFVYAAFVSTGGRGLTVLFRIFGGKHRLAFLGISEYLIFNYGLIPDPQSISVSKPFGVTFDPFIYIAEKEPPLFTLYPKEKKVEKLQNFAYAKDDFEKLIKELVQRQINICEDYDSWLKVGFAFANKFGESGRDYYHSVSAVSSKYNKVRTDKQYGYALRGKNLNIATISTFYYYCKDAGLQITSERTEKIRRATLNAKNAGLKKEQIVKNLKDKYGIEGAEDTVEGIYDGINIIGDGESLLDQLEMFLSSNYALERNVITRYIERNGKSLDQRALFSMYVAAKKQILMLNYGDFEKVVFSDFVPEYNPIHRYLESLPVKKVKFGDEFKSPLIDKLASSIKNDIQPFTEYFLRKWLVSSIASIHLEHSPLMLVLSGPRTGTGKTQFFRRLLPPEMRMYYAESKLDAGKDDEILMTQKWFIMDDEMSGKSKRETQRLKELTSKQCFSLREPYGRANVDLQRIAILCATTNSNEIMVETLDNRRIIPIPVQDIDKDVYNSVDKAELFAEIYCLWKDGFDFNVVTEDDKRYLNTYSSEFESFGIEKELLLKYFSCEKPDTYLWATEIKVELERMTNQKLSIDTIGRKLSEIGYTKKSIRIDGRPTKKWYVRRVNRGTWENEAPQPEYSEPKSEPEKEPEPVKVREISPEENGISRRGFEPMNIEDF